MLPRPLRPWGKDNHVTLTEDSKVCKDEQEGDTSGEGEKQEDGVGVSNGADAMVLLRKKIIIDM